MTTDSKAIVGSVVIFYTSHLLLLCTSTDDIMEPYRPYVDKLVIDMIGDGAEPCINATNKIKLLNIPVIDVIINGRRSPLMIAVSQTVSSLVKCFRGECRKLAYPEM